MYVSIKLQGQSNVPNNFDADKLKDLCQNMHVSDLLAIVEESVAKAAKKATR